MIGFQTRYEGMSRRQFLAMTGAAGVALGRIRRCCQACRREVITTPAVGLATMEGKVAFRRPSRIPIYESARRNQERIP